LPFYRVLFFISLKYLKRIPQAIVVEYAQIGFFIDEIMMKQVFFDDESPVIEPAREAREPLLGEWAIMVATPSELSSMAAIVNAEKTPLSAAYPFKLFIIKKGNNNPIGLAGPFLGAPQAVILMEKLIAMGAKNILVSGWCGSLQPNIVIGDYIIPTSALSEEGTSSHYPVDKGHIGTSDFLNDKLFNVFGNAHINTHKGIIWTTDALYRETKKKVEDYSEKGLLAVEMEMSALINLAAYRNVEVSGVLTVSDELFQPTWHHGFGGKKLKKNSIRAGRLILKLCVEGE
jgi:uridine phosphorylase